VDYEILMPGAILDTNELKICPFLKDTRGFSYLFDPTKIQNIYKNYEIAPLSRMVFMYFHVTGKKAGTPFQQFGVVMLRGDHMYAMRIPPPP